MRLEQGGIRGYAEVEVGCQWGILCDENTGLMAIGVNPWYR